MFRSLRCASMVAMVAFGLVASSFAQRQVGTIGPPPRKHPQRQTSAEGFPPLPLPVTPLRRSEPKTKPSPPLFAAKLIYGDDQDYMPNPGDIDNLMRHARRELGLWYGWKVVDLQELVALHKQNKQSKLPLLQISGYEAFEFTGEQRETLRQYVLGGGTLFGDATLGSPDFTKSFRDEMRTTFSDRPFELLSVEHPIYRAYYTYTNVRYFDVEQGYELQTRGPPELLGINIGTRTAVVLSPHDMSCGWNEFIAPSSKTRVPDAPRGQALIPGDALRLGLNIVSYVAALREVGNVESVTRRVSRPGKRVRQSFTLAQLRHQGDWNPDPNSTYQWLRHLSQEPSLSAGFDLKYVDPAERDIAAHPFLFLTGFRDPRFTDREKEALKRHIAAGGFLFINNCSGLREFDQHARRLIGELFPDLELARLAKEHPIYQSVYDIGEVRDRRTGAVRPAELQGVTAKDRLVLVYSKNDMITHLKQISDPFGNGFDADSCRQLAVNLVSYVLQN